MATTDIAGAIRLMRQIERRAKDSGRAFANAMNAEMRAARAEITRELEKEDPRQSSGTYRWSYDPAANARARRWWFANYVNRKGGRRQGGRYKRTGRTVKSWKVTGTFARNQGAITITNEAPGAKYVFVKAHQNPSHTRTGWKTVEQRKRQFTPILTKRYKRVWERHGNPLRG